MNDEKWNKMSLAQKLGNIGSEVARAIYWQDKGESKEFDFCYHNILAMLNSTINGLQDQPLKRKELLLLKEVLVSYFEKRGFQKSKEALKNYFLPFALLATKNL